MRTMRNKNLLLKDLIDIATFKKWIRDSIYFHKNNEVSDQHVLIYLDYIMDMVKSNLNISKDTWIAQIVNLKERLRIQNEQSKS